MWRSAPAARGPAASTTRARRPRAASARCPAASGTGFAAGQSPAAAVEVAGDRAVAPRVARPGGRRRRWRWRRACERREGQLGSNWATDSARDTGQRDRSCILIRFELRYPQRNRAACQAPSQQRVRQSRFSTRRTERKPSGSESRYANPDKRPETPIRRYTHVCDKARARYACRSSFRT
jgi:hypothetical protein